MPKLLHISDVHIGKPFTSFGDKGRFLREVQLETFKSILELGQKEKVAGVLISGDLFDSNNVGNLLAEVQKIIKDSGLKFYILPGAGESGISGHDALVPGSVYYRKSWEEIGNVHIFRMKEGESFDDPENGITFYGRPTGYGESPIPSLEKNKNAKYHIALSHGSVALREEYADYPIKRDEIENSGYHYIALGHWHNIGDYSTGRTKAFYPGSPEILEISREGRGTALLISLDDNDIAVEPLEIGKFLWASYELDVSLDETDIAGLIRRNFEEPSNTILTVKLKGNAPFQKLERLKITLRKALQEFFWLYIDDRNVRPEIDHSVYSESTVIGQFIKIMNDKIHHAEGEELEAQKEALNLGVGLLTGQLDKKSISLEDFLRQR